MRVVVALGVLAFCGAASAQWSDDFNRPDGAIGGDWTVVSGTWAIAANQGRHTSSPSNEVLQHNVASLATLSSVSSLDVYSGAASQFSAVLIGLGGTDTIMVKVQDQVTGTPGFSNIGFYHKTSATAYGQWTGTTTLTNATVSTSGFVTIPAGMEFLAGRMTVTFPDADTVRLDIDTDFNGTADQTYTRTGVSTIAANLGMSHGISGWGNTATFDNWSVTPEAAPCYPDCNNSGGLTIADFACFQASFANNEPYADCNNSGGLTIADFACFQAAFANGCP